MSPALEAIFTPSPGIRLCYWDRAPLVDDALERGLDVASSVLLFIFSPSGIFLSAT